MSKALACILTICILASCGKEKRVNPQQVAATPSSKTEEMLVGVNRYMSEKDKDIIDGYSKRHKLQLQQSQDGYYFHLLEEGKGRKAKEGSEVELTGSVALINGNCCYTYAASNPKIVRVGKSPEISGLHIALPQFNEGSRVLLIFPPNLAYGLLGDGNKIPSRSILVFDINIEKVEG